jgi:hypothetical protein
MRNFPFIEKNVTGRHRPLYVRKATAVSTSFRQFLCRQLKSFLGEKLVGYGWLNGRMGE